MVALRERPARALQPFAPVGQLLGEPRFRWQPHEDAWLYRIELWDHEGRFVGRGWSGQHELPLAWLRDAEGYPPRLSAGAGYKWRVAAYKGGPDGPPLETDEAEFLFLGP
jgi:hypothetical protein